LIEDHLTKVRGIVPLLRAEAAEGERLGTLTPAVDRALTDLKLLTLLLARRWGGAELSITDYLRIHFELAKGDLSACWIVFATNAACWLWSRSSDACQEAVFGAGPKVICGATYPFGRGEEIDGGYVIDGAWNYMSGCRQADWVWGAVSLIDRNGQKVPGKAIALFPIADVEILKTWDVTGLRATGSDTVVAKKVFVPYVRMVMPDKKFGSWDADTKHAATPLDRIGPTAAVRVVGLGQLVGGALAMLEMIQASASTAPASFAPVAAGHSLERAAAQIDLARTLVFDMTYVLDEVGRGNASFTMADSARQKSQCGQVGELVLAAVESMMFIAGSSAFARANPLNRYWRDIHMAMRHNNHVFFGNYSVSGTDRVASWKSPGALAMQG
jgi:alkylation response protein AidB-like acyl-CoA dehydrogenase